MDGASFLVAQTGHYKACKIAITHKHTVTWLLGYLVTWLLGYLVTCDNVVKVFESAACATGSDDDIPYDIPHMPCRRVMKMASVRLPMHGIWNTKIMKTNTNAVWPINTVNWFTKWAIIISVVVTPATKLRSSRPCFLSLMNTAAVSATAMK